MIYDLIRRCRPPRPVLRPPINTPRIPRRPLHSSTPAMTSILHSIQNGASFISAANAPVDTDGNPRPLPSLLTRTVDDIEQEIKNGPAFTLADVVSAFD